MLERRRHPLPPVVVMGQSTRIHLLSSLIFLPIIFVRAGLIRAKVPRTKPFGAATVLGVALASVALTGAFLPSRSQTEGSSSLRAVNMARMSAERLNGGLQAYRAAACMHQQSGGSCLIQSSSEGYVFRFYGGDPGWQQLGKLPTVETELLVAPDGRSIRKVIYNGPVRSGGTSPR